MPSFGSGFKSHICMNSTSHRWARDSHTWSFSVSLYFFQHWKIFSAVKVVLNPPSVFQSAIQNCTVLYILWFTNRKMSYIEIQENQVEVERKPRFFMGESIYLLTCLSCLRTGCLRRAGTPRACNSGKNGGQIFNFFPPSPPSGGLPIQI